MRKRCIILIFLSSLWFASLNAQVRSEVRKFQDNSLDKIHHYKSAENNTTELHILFSGLFLFYKNFISSQDGNTCVFTPSCSEYALMSIKTLGLVKGTANTFDRLMRCNGLSADKYQKHPDQSHLIDSLTVL